jgi:hypothetical protein
LQGPSMVCEYPLCPHRRKVSYNPKLILCIRPTVTKGPETPAYNIRNVNRGVVVRDDNDDDDETF